MHKFIIIISPYHSFANVLIDYLSDLHDFRNDRSHVRIFLFLEATSDGLDGFFDLFVALSIRFKGRFFLILFLFQFLFQFDDFLLLLPIDLLQCSDLLLSFHQVFYSNIVGHFSFKIDSVNPFFFLSDFLGMILIRNGNFVFP